MNLTTKEREVLNLMLQHDCDRDRICKQLNITQQTLKTHMKNLREKTIANSTAAIITKAIKLELF